MKKLKYYKDLSYVEKEKVVSLVFKEAERIMRKGIERINYHELARTIFVKTGVTIHEKTIYRWITGKQTPLNEFKAARRPPDDDAPIVRGLILTDLVQALEKLTIILTLYTTKDFFAYRVSRLLRKYGWTRIIPRLVKNIPEWELQAYIDRRQWTQELQKPIEKLTNDEKMKLLSGLISGDGFILAKTYHDTIRFTIGLSTTEKHNAVIFRQVLESMSIPYVFTKERLRRRENRFGDFTIRTRSNYEYRFIIMAESAVKHLLISLRLVEPFRNVKRIIALTFIEKDMFDADLVKPVWRYLRAVEKASTIRSQIMACEQIPDEKFAKKNLDKQRILKELYRRLYEYADRVRELRPAAVKIISGLRIIPKGENVMKLAEEVNFAIPSEAGFMIARKLEKHQRQKISNNILEKCARALIGANLVRLGLVKSQREAARLLLITQPAISQHLYKKNKMSQLLKLPEIEQLSREYFAFRSHDVIMKVQWLLQTMMELCNG